MSSNNLDLSVFKPLRKASLWGATRSEIQKLLHGRATWVVSAILLAFTALLVFVSLAMEKEMKTGLVQIFRTNVMQNLCMIASAATVLLYTSEYSSRSVVPTMTALPRRWQVWSAKMLVGFLYLVFWWVLLWLALPYLFISGVGAPSAVEIWSSILGLAAYAAFNVGLAMLTRSSVLTIVINILMMILPQFLLISGKKPLVWISNHLPLNALQKLTLEPTINWSLVWALAGWTLVFLVISFVRVTKTDV